MGIHAEASALFRNAAPAPPLTPGGAPPPTVLNPPTPLLSLAVHCLHSMSSKVSSGQYSCQCFGTAGMPCHAVLMCHPQLQCLHDTHHSHFSTKYICVFAEQCGGALHTPRDNPRQSCYCTPHPHHSRGLKLLRSCPCPILVF